MSTSHLIPAFLTVALVAATQFGRAPAAEAGPVAGANHERVTLVPTAIADRGQHMTAATILMPQGWTLKNGVGWDPNSWTQGFVSFEISDPQTGRALALYPSDSYIQLRPTPYFNPSQGSRYLGMTVQSAPRDILSYVQWQVRKHYPAEAHARIIGRRELPRLAQIIRQNVQEPGFRKTVAAEAIRIEHKRGGKLFHEDLYVCMVWTPWPNGSIGWGPALQFGLRAPAGQLDAATPLLYGVGTTLRVTQRWFSYRAFVQKLFQMRLRGEIEAAGRLSRQLSANNDAILRMFHDAYENRSRALDRINRNFSQYIRGTATYARGGTSYQLPSYYSHVWQGDDGRIILTNDPTDPNTLGVGNWHRLNLVQ